MTTKYCVQPDGPPCTPRYIFFSFAHVNQGIISYYIFDYWYYGDEGRSNSRNSNVGLVKALFAGVAWELVENTEIVVNLFRKNSGKNGFSLINLIDTHQAQEKYTSLEIFWLFYG